ncbi:hypothetical protein PACTADRAFT_23618, partial [Pachysolen tannophilus NRRL Y-2460]
SRKFEFDWDAEDDTLQDYNPIVMKKPSMKLYRASHVKNGAGAHGDDSELRHWSEKSLEEMTDRDWRILKEDFNITIKSNSGNSSGNSKVKPPLRSFDESSMPFEVLEILHSLKFTVPTAIQRAAIPIAIDNLDIIGIAETGSGKTLSFIVPILSNLLNLPPLDDMTQNDGPYVLVLAPTRELALQIEKEFKKFLIKLKEINHSYDLNCCSIIGGHSFEELIYKLKNGSEIIIATPGRLIDCIERKILVFNQCKYLVMDEADRMIDMGFEEQVNKILEMLPLSTPSIGEARRTTMMFTATMSSSIEKIAKNYLYKPNIVVIGDKSNIRGGGSGSGGGLVSVNRTADTISQEVEFISSDDKKFAKILQLLSSNKYKPPIIIFLNYKKTCEDLNFKLMKERFKSVTLHGSKSQEKREQAIQQIKNGEKDILIATDVAGRGIDINNVSLVINYQMAKTVEDYTHRIGRTGRAGKKGKAITFLNEDDDKDILYDLYKFLSNSKFTRIPEELKKNQ